jgi:4-amino-4-deoxy-L-arabinose transferase-like glycosyltransferase
VVGVAALTRALGGPASGGALVAIGVLLAPAAFGSNANSLLSDVGSGAAVVAATAAALRTRSPGPAWAWPLICGLALGLAVGSKLIALVPAATVLALVLVVREDRWRRATVVVAAAAPLVLFWLVRDAVEFGNPLYPFGGGPLDGLSSPLNQFDTPIAVHLAEFNGDVLSEWLRLARDFVGFAFLLPFAAAVIAVIAWRRGHGDLARVALVTVAALLTYLITPFTGGGPDGNVTLLGSSLRYAMPVFLLAAAVAAAAARRWSPLVAAPLVLFGVVKLFDAASTGRPDMEVTAPRALAALAGGAVAAGVWAYAPRVRASARITAAAAAALLAVALAAVLHHQDPRPPTLSERLLASCTSGPVGVVHTRDLRSLMGRRFDVPVVMVDRPAPAGRRPIADAAALDRRISELRPGLLVRLPGVLEPRGWGGPPGWHPVGEVKGATVLAPPGRC